MDDPLNEEEEEDYFLGGGDPFSRNPPEAGGGPTSESKARRAEEEEETAEDDTMVTEGRRVVERMGIFRNGLVDPVFSDPPLPAFDLTDVVEAVKLRADRKTNDIDVVRAQWSRFQIPPGARTWGDINDASFKDALIQLAALCRVTVGTLEQTPYDPDTPLAPFLAARVWEPHRPTGFCSALGLVDGEGGRVFGVRSDSVVRDWHESGAEHAYMYYAREHLARTRYLDQTARAAVQWAYARYTADWISYNLKEGLDMHKGPLVVRQQCLLPPPVIAAVGALALRDRNEAPVGTAQVDAFLAKLYRAQLDILIGLARSRYWGTLRRSEAVLTQLVKIWSPLYAGDDTAQRAYALLLELKELAPHVDQVDAQALAKEALELAARQSMMNNKESAQRLAEGVKNADGIPAEQTFVRPVEDWCARAVVLIEEAQGTLHRMKEAPAPEGSGVLAQLSVTAITQGY